MLCYEISKIVLVKLHETHIPYFGYMEVTGPKGGKYIVDEFNTHKICNIATDKRTTSLNEVVIMTRLGRAENIIEFTNVQINDTTIKKVAKEKKAVLLQRLEGIKYANVIGKGLSDETKKKIMREAVAYHREIIGN